MKTELTGKQLYELKWFCQNVTGMKTEFYAAMDGVKMFEAKFLRLEKTAALIEKFIEANESPRPAKEKL